MSTDKPSPFAGSAFRRAPTHQKPVLPAGEDMAAMLRAGESLEDLGELFERSPFTLRPYINDAGYSATTGEPTTPRFVDDLEPGELLSRPFRYPPWMDDAICSSTDPELFFPEKGGNTRQAIETCHRCPVAAECLDYATENGEVFGIWGGLSTKRRQKLVAAMSTTTVFPTADALHQEEESA